MKKLFLIIIALIPMFVNAQNINDIYNISTSYYQGTAKSVAMGNAMGAVGQDFSSISINPAGLGLFRKPTFVFTPSVVTTYTTTDFNGSSAFDSKAKLSVNNFGYVGVEKLGNNIATWAFGMNRTNNYNNSVYIDGNNPENSLIDAYFAEIYSNGIYNDMELEMYSPSYIYPLWQTYLINFEQDGLLTTPVPEGGIRQIKGTNSWGGTNEWTVAASINYSDKLFLGFAINMPYVYSRRITDYKEEFSLNAQHKGYWLQEEVSSTTGWGFNGKLGLIAYPCRWLRLGASFHTPTFYNLTDSWRTETVSQLDGIYRYNAPTSYFYYTMITPLRANASAAFIFGNFGMLTADYEIVDYGTIRLSSYDYNYDEYNKNISYLYSTTMNLRLGTEWRYQNYCFRGGYAFYGSPYGVTEDDYRRNSLSCGLGFTKHSFTFDIAYAYTLQNHNYNIYSQYTNYYTEVAPNYVNERTNFHNIVMTLKFRIY